MCFSELKDTSNGSLDLNGNIGLSQNQYSSIPFIRDPMVTNMIYPRYNENNFELRINSISSIQDSLSGMSISIENQ